jgi:hypothetical protein
VRGSGGLVSPNRFSTRSALAHPGDLRDAKIRLLRTDRRVGASVVLQDLPSENIGGVFSAPLRRAGCFSAGRSGNGGGIFRRVSRDMGRVRRTDKGIRPKQSPISGPRKTNSTLVPRPSVQPWRDGPLGKGSRLSLGILTRAYAA